MGKGAHAPRCAYICLQPFNLYIQLKSFYFVVTFVSEWLIRFYSSDLFRLLVLFVNIKSKKCDQNIVSQITDHFAQPMVCHYQRVQSISTLFSYRFPSLPFSFTCSFFVLFVSSFTPSHHCRSMLFFVKEEDIRFTIVLGYKIRL